MFTNLRSKVKTGIDLHTTKFCLVNLSGLTLFILAILQGWIYHIFSTDISNISFLISISFLIGLYFTYLKKWKVVYWLSNSLVLFGLLGTVIGFNVALGGVTPEAVSDFSETSNMVTHLLMGVRVAINTTIVGIIGFFWLSLNTIMLRQHDKIN